MQQKTSKRKQEAAIALWLSAALGAVAFVIFGALVSIQRHTFAAVFLFLGLAAYAWWLFLIAPQRWRKTIVLAGMIVAAVSAWWWATCMGTASPDATKLTPASNTNLRVRNDSIVTGPIQQQVQGDQNAPFVGSGNTVMIGKSSKDSGGTANTTADHSA